MTRPTWDQRRLAFGGWAAAYDRFRPTYPTSAVSWLVGGAADADGRGSLDVLDVGAGTGRLSLAVVALGHRVVAVEPDAAMRAIAEGHLPGRTLAGTAESLPVGDGTYDVVVAGQAYHWFDREQALPEIARVLRPGGTLGLVWNTRDDRPAFGAKIDAEVGGEDRRSIDERTGRPDLEPWFGPVRARSFRFEQDMDVDELVGLVASFSYVALRPDRDEVLDRVRAIGEAHRRRVRRDRFGLPYLTRAFRATVRRSARGRGAARPA
jgi:SAM-dependent methyltransferase